MNIFLVRHGTTGLIEQNIRQSQNSPLSPEGIIQAKAVAQKLKSKTIDYLLSSSWTRTVETAEIIRKTLGLQTIINPQLHEILHHKDLYGTSELDPIYHEYREQKTAMLTDLDWRFKNAGESLRDLIKRAIQVKNQLMSEYPEFNLCLVSHSHFIRAFTSSCILGDSYDDSSMLHLFHSLNCGNVSIIHLERPLLHHYYQLKQLDNEISDLANT